MMEGNNAHELPPVYRRTMKILTIGASGTGKSALINGFVGKNVANEGGGETRFTQTRQLTSYRASRNDSDIEIWDSPGMEVANASGELEQLATDIEQKVRAVDLVLFCINMTSPRFRQGDHQNVKIVTVAFGESIWKNTVFVLTFANLVKPPPSSEGTPPIEYFNERLRDWEGEIQTALKRSSVSSGLAQSIKIVPAGYHDERLLPGKDNHWFNDIWHTCLEVTKSGAQAILHVSMVRLTAETASWLDVEKSIRVKYQPVTFQHSKKLIIVVGIIAIFAAAAAWRIAGGRGMLVMVIGAGLLGVMGGFAYWRWRLKEE